VAACSCEKLDSAGPRPKPTIFPEIERLFCDVLYVILSLHGVHLFFVNSKLLCLVNGGTWQSAGGRETASST